jgi:hypothetical protein
MLGHDGFVDKGFLNIRIYATLNSIKPNMEGATMADESETRRPMSRRAACRAAKTRLRLSEQVETVLNRFVVSLSLQTRPPPP